MPDPDTEIKRQLPLGSIGEIYRIKTKRACLFYGSEVCEVTHKKHTFLRVNDGKVEWVNFFCLKK